MPRTVAASLPTLVYLRNRLCSRGSTLQFIDGSHGRNVTGVLHARSPENAAAKRKARALQFGVIPWRISDRGTRQVMLLTSRETHRWVIPKGWPMKGRKPA